MQLPNELWMEILSHVPESDDIRGMRALWRCRSVSRRFRELVDVSLVRYFQDFQLRIVVEMKSLEYKALHPPPADPTPPVAGGGGGAPLVPPALEGRDVVPPAATPFASMVPLAASLPVSSHSAALPRPSTSAGYNSIALECSGFDYRNRVYEFTPVASTSVEDLSSSDSSGARSHRRQRSVSPGSRSRSVSPVPSIASSTTTTTTTSTLSSSPSSPNNPLDDGQGSDAGYPRPPGLITYTRLGSADSIRDMRVSFDGWQTSYGHYYQRPSPSSENNPRTQQASLRSGTISKNPYHHRIYRLELNDLPGTHYVGEKDMILQYSLRRFEKELVRYVPKPGATGAGEKMAIRAHDVRYQFQLERVLVHPTWILNGMLRYGQGEKGQIFERALERLWQQVQLEQQQLEIQVPSEDHLPVPSPTPLQTIHDLNVRAEFVLHYLQKHYHLDPTISSTSSDTASLSALARFLLATHGLPDRRHFITRQMAANEDLTAMLRWLQLPLDESCWWDENILRHVVGKSLPQGSLPTYAVMHGTTPALEWDGIWIKLTGEFQEQQSQLQQQPQRVPTADDHRGAGKRDWLIRKWYEVLLGELRMQ